jgi:hypothetical protein
MAIARASSLFASAALTAGCASSTPPTIAPSAVPPSVATPTGTPLPSLAVTTPSPSPVETAAASPTPSAPFTSKLYGYVVLSPDWTGTAATTACDGSGAPGNGDTDIVDTLIGPIPNTFAFGEPTTSTLDQFAAALRAANADVHPCPAEPDSTTPTVGGARAILDAVDCGDVFVLTAYIVRAARGYVFVSFGNSDAAAAQRDGVDALLRVIRFQP